MRSCLIRARRSPLFLRVAPFEPQPFDARHMQLPTLDLDILGDREPVVHVMPAFKAGIRTQALEVRPTRLRQMLQGIAYFWIGIFLQPGMPGFPGIPFPSCRTSGRGQPNAGPPCSPRAPVACGPGNDSRNNDRLPLRRRAGTRLCGPLSLIILQVSYSLVFAALSSYI